MPISRLGYVNNGTKKEFPVISALPREMTMAEFALLSDEEKMGDIIVTDYPVDEESDYVEVVADGVKTTAQLLNELYALVDASRINMLSNIERATNTGIVTYDLYYAETNTYYFTSVTVFDTFMSFDTVIVRGSNSNRYEYDGHTISDKTSAVPASGRTIRLYYNDAHTFDFNTKAENCIYGNSNVKDALDKIINAPTSPSYSVTEGATVKSFSGASNTAYDWVVSTAGWFSVWLDGNTDLRFEGNYTGWTNQGNLGLRYLVYCPVGTHRIRYYGGASGSGCTIKEATIS